MRRSCSIDGILARGPLRGARAMNKPDALSRGAMRRAAVSIAMSMIEPREAAAPCDTRGLDRQRFDMRRVIGERKDFLICEESIPAPSSLGGKPPRDAPLPITLWTSSGYFIRAFATEDDARAFVVQQELLDRPMAFKLDGGGELFVRGFAIDGHPSVAVAQVEFPSTCWICSGDGKEIDKVDGLALAITAIHAQRAHAVASIAGPHPVLSARKPR